MIRECQPAVNTAQWTVSLLLSSNRQSYFHNSSVQTGSRPRSNTLNLTQYALLLKEHRAVKWNSTSALPLPIYCSALRDRTLFLEEDHPESVGWNTKSAHALSKPSPDSSADVGSGFALKTPRHLLFWLVKGSHLRENIGDRAFEGVSADLIERRFVQLAEPSEVYTCFSFASSTRLFSA